MQTVLSPNQLTELGLSPVDTQQLLEKINYCIAQQKTPEKQWQMLTRHVLAEYPFKIHLYLFSLFFPKWREYPETAIAWMPSQSILKTANITQFMTKLKISHVKDFHRWSYTQYQDFWQQIIKELNIIFSKNPNAICDLSKGLPIPQWLPGAALNIADSCFTALPSKPAIIYQNAQKQICTVSYGELNELSNCIANSLIRQGFIQGDVIGIVMPMTMQAVAIYLGIIKIGGIVVSIADSFSGQEIVSRLHTVHAKALFTQDFVYWCGKKLSLYEKIKNVNDEPINHWLKIIVLPYNAQISLPLHKEDMAWNQFLVPDHVFSSTQCEPMSPCHILFSSGTTTEPKAIIWNHTTPIKTASDAFFHQNIQPNDILAWPTNLGWMMGPWLIFAALLNKASIALYGDAPKDREFGEFVQNANVTLLGVVPTLVATWRQSQCMEKLNWEQIKVFSSTGECSNQEDMLYLMSLANYKPIIEYCGGTEIGGAYVSSTVIENNIPSLFSTAAMGLNFLLLDENGKSTDAGEVALVPPSIGFSTQLWNRNHTDVYFAKMPKTQDGKVLRRHGDQLKRFSTGYYCVLGRIDDTMNLGGIKISAAEIERAVAGIPGIQEVAAIAISPSDNRPQQLIIYATGAAQLDKKDVLRQMQKKINTYLNPLFKIHDVVLTHELPKTASNKIMRRTLRQSYVLQHKLDKK